MKFDLKKNSSSSAAGGGRPTLPPPVGKRYKLEFSHTGLVGFVAVTLLGLVWVFIFGVLVGRGYRPETAVPELARIMPAEQNAGKVLADQGVLPPEELEFYDALRKGGNVSPTLPSEAVAVSGPVSDTSLHPAFEDEDLPPAEVVQDLARTGTPVAAAPAASPKHQPAQPAAASKPAVAKPAAPAAQPPVSDDDTGPPGQRYAYVYQAAAFNEAAKAEAFKGKMHALNLKASVQKVEDNGKTWHRVMVHFEGTPEDTRLLKEKLRQAGIEKALLRSKKPI
ncbi:MAG: SPOR domain-containing protein [Desulfovibrio sp.]|nr:SPOR domain-containing protein [Desulfovibrio sp.]